MLSSFKPFPNEIPATVFTLYMFSVFKQSIQCYFNLSDHPHLR